MNGFSLVELMLSLSLGLGLSGVMLQGLMAEGQNGARLSRLLRERAAQRRTLELVKGDLARALAVSAKPDQEQHACGLSARIPVLHLVTAAGPITYSVGRAPSRIWRGRVLMRCGPAFDLNGGLSVGSSALNRVVIDGLAEQPRAWSGCTTQSGTDLAGASCPGFSVCQLPELGLIRLRLLQELGDPARDRPQRIEIEAVAALP
jgi:hypothetical protein